MSAVTPTAASPTFGSPARDAAGAASSRRSARAATPRARTKTPTRRGSVPLGRVTAATVASPEVVAAAKTSVNPAPVAVGTPEARQAAAARREQPKPTIVERVRDIAHDPGSHKGILLIAVLVVVLVGLYGPVRDLYVAKRDSEVLTSQLSAVTASNEAMTQDMTALQTREGIEDEARRRGYVAEGDTPVNMEGVESADGSAVQSLASDATVVDAPWYEAFLDGIFNYQEVPAS